MAEEKMSKSSSVGFAFKSVPGSQTTGLFGGKIQEVKEEKSKEEEGNKEEKAE